MERQRVRKVQMDEEGKSEKDDISKDVRERREESESVGKEVKGK